MHVGLVHRWSARAKQAVIMRMSSALLPRRAAYCSDGITPSDRSWPPLWPREAVLALLKTRNRLFEWRGQMPVKGLKRCQLLALGAILLYQIVLLYQHQRQQPVGVGVKALLRAA